MRIHTALMHGNHRPRLSRRPRSQWLNIALIASFALFASGQSDWNLVWSDDFNRESLGPDWRVHAPEADIVEGQLHLKGHSATVLTTRGFAHDVRLTYTAKQDPSAPNVDLSSTTGASEIFGWGHLHSLGLNDLTPGDPKYHETYQMLVEKEGRRIRFYVNGDLANESFPDEILGGSGMDRVGFVTWGGMFVDNFKVYERATPHPESPRFPRELPNAPITRVGRQLQTSGPISEIVSDGVSAFNAGSLSQAARRFQQDRSFSAALGWAYALGDLAYTERFHHPEFRDLANAFTELADQNDDPMISAYAAAAREFSNLVMRRTRDARTATLRLVGLGERNNPFYHKARFYLARYHYWDGMEGGRSALRGRAVGWMRDLRELWPEQSILRQYTGDDVPWGERFNADVENHPAWAAYLREAYARNVEIMETFFGERQTPDGQLHGGWGDDVELLRTWTQIAAISSAPKAVIDGIEKLSNGVWTQVLNNGYGNYSDVEHSSEDSADTIPGMLFLKYGDPLWVERNLQTCRRIQDLYMGTDNRGYPRFISSYFGGERVGTHLQDGGDVGYCARPMKHFLWAAWQGHPGAKDWFLRWADGWRAATLGTEAGKLPGVAPLGIWYPSGSISPPVDDRDWTDDQLHRWRHVPMMHDAILAAYWLSNDRKFLEPWRKAMQWATRGPLIQGALERGSKEWQIAETSHLPSHNHAEQNRAALYRWLSDDTVYDEYILRAGGGAVFSYRLNGDLSAFLESFEKTAKRLRSNLELQTTEVLSTDRAALRGAIDIFGAYTGAITGLRDAATPTFAVTYDTPSTDFAALVVASSDERLRLWLYQFADEPISIGLKLWNLQPGEYEFLQGEKLPGERKDQYRYAWEPAETFVYRRRAEGPSLHIPPGKVWVVDLRLTKPMDMPSSIPDLAINPRDIQVTKRGVEVTVHNIGTQDSDPTTVALQLYEGDAWRTIAHETIPTIAAPLDWIAKTKTIHFNHKPHGRFRVLIDPDSERSDNHLRNNSATYIQ